MTSRHSQHTATPTAIPSATPDTPDNPYDRVDPPQSGLLSARAAALAAAELDDAELGDTDDGIDGEQLEREERAALRRVAGLSTELADVTEVEYRQLRLERVVLASVWSDGTAEDAENSLAELKLLAETAGSEVLDALLQRRQRPDAAGVRLGRRDRLRLAHQLARAEQGRQERLRLRLVLLPAGGLPRLPAGPRQDQRGQDPGRGAA